MNKVHQKEEVANLNPHNSIPVDALELIRNRLNQVHQSLRKLSDQIHHTNRNPKAKLPSYSNLHGQLQVLLTQLHSIASQLDTNDQVLKSTNVYPLPNFPTTQNEGLVTTLLRKKPLPEVDEWISGAIAESEAFKLPIETDNEFAEWCHSKVTELEEEFNFDGFYTEAEVKAMQAQKSGGDNEEEKKKKELDYLKSQKPWTPNMALKFMCKGVIDEQ